jgi:hypothetical protein
MSKPEYRTQGRRLIEHLKRRPMTYGEMQMLGISTSPQKRCVECLYPNERIVKTKGHDNLIRWRVRRLTAGER